MKMTNKKILKINEVAYLVMITYYLITSYGTNHLNNLLTVGNIIVANIGQQCEIVKKLGNDSERYRGIIVVPYLGKRFCSRQVNTIVGEVVGQMRSTYEYFVCC